MIVIKQRTKHIQRITYCSIFPTFHIRGWNDEHRKTSLLRSCWIRTTVTHRWYDDVSSYVFLLVQHLRLSQQTTFVLETLTVFSSISLIIINFSLFRISVIVSFPEGQCGSRQVAEFELGVLPKVPFIAKLIQRKVHHLLRLFSSHFQQLFYFGSGLSILSSNQSSHLWYVFAGISPRLSRLDFFLSKKYPMRDT